MKTFQLVLCRIPRDFSLKREKPQKRKKKWCEVIFLLPYYSFSVISISIILFNRCAFGHFWFIWYLIPTYTRRFTQFGAICTIQKLWKTPIEECYLKPATLLKVIFLHRCFSRFSNCRTGSDLCKGSYIIILYLIQTDVEYS